VDDIVYILSVKHVTNVLFVVCVEDIASFPELALTSVLIGHLDNNEYVTVDGARLFHCPSSDVSDDTEVCCHDVEAHLCLVEGILPPQPCLYTYQHQLTSSAAAAESIILRLTSVLRQLSLARCQTEPTASHNSMSYYFILLGSS